MNYANDSADPWRVTSDTSSFAPPPEASPPEIAAKGMQDWRPDELRDTSDKRPGHAVKPWDGWADWQRSLQEQDRQSFFRVAASGNQLNRFRIAKGRMTVLGGQQGTGKTLLTMQLLFNIVMEYPEISVLVANCEMDPGELLDRNVARLAEVPYAVVRDRRYRGGQRQRVLDAAGEIMPLKERVSFMQPPFSMERLKALAERIEADIVCIDYLQRFRVSGVTDFRMQVSDVMSEARELAMRGPAVVLLSALSRQGEFRESSEVEFACDYAYKLVPQNEDGTEIKCECHKARNAAKENIDLTCNHSMQEFLAPAEDQFDEPEPHTEFAAWDGGSEF
ncbi:DnaB-like helicase C-terminal domain-containing protein [Aeoliella mucimassa]|uniref:Replicative DNA helicase n=1 Tax=Aeoliella mucimassa TaxID=2527972 RepID=A0A518ALV6_9BACT|nr:DnaB-like helicase C-terminal domain-containing protein [Aeoliella mucimassa]QDU55693.1 replicative DNA helicase [Aeoliella mucimassa]